MLRLPGVSHAGGKKKALMLAAMFWSGFVCGSVVLFLSFLVAVCWDEWKK